MKLRVRVPDKSSPQTLDIENDTQWSILLLMLEEASNIPSDQIKVLNGYPPKAMEGIDDYAPISSLFREGEVLIIQRGEAKVHRGVTDGVYVPPSSDRGFFVRRICPADNSCLFHAIAYVAMNKSRTDGPSLRTKCAEYLLSYPDEFNATLLEMPPTRYASQLLHPDFWGGAIELMIFSRIFQIEIVTLDLESARMERFGENSDYTVRAFVVYTGKHYDAIAVNTTYNSPNETQDQVLFNTRDVRVIDRAVRFVKEEALKGKK